MKHLAKLIAVGTALLLPSSAAGAQFRSVSVGDQYACGVTPVGVAQCWGRNVGGSLGNGRDGSGNGLKATIQPLPGNVVGLTAVSQVSIGFDQTPSCALTISGGVKCWGGEGSSVPVDAPGFTSGVSEISGTCALLASGGVKCGVGTDSPADISGLGGQPTSLGGACAVVDGSAKCWDLRSVLPPTGPINIASDVPGLSPGILQISGSLTRGCAVTTAGGLKCWGMWPGNGAVGKDSPAVDVPGLTSGVRSVSVGATTCAILTGGGIACWGDYQHGQIGDGEVAGWGGDPKLTPVRVVGLNAAATSVSAGVGSVCATLSNLEASCWGTNFMGELGDGTRSDKYFPGAHLPPVRFIERRPRKRTRIWHSFGPVKLAVSLPKYHGPLTANACPRYALVGGIDDMIGGFGDADLMPAERRHGRWKLQASKQVKLSPSGRNCRGQFKVINPGDSGIAGKRIFGVEVPTFEPYSGVLQRMTVRIR